MKKFLIAAALAFSASGHAQNIQLQAGVPPALEVQRLAPQLVVFAGGELNFANLVNGLAFGVPVTLTTPLSSGLTEVVTFTPAGAMTPLAIAQTLEAARQSLISRGIAVPTAQQLGVTLAGGTLATALGTVAVSPLVTTAAAATAATAGTVASSPSLLQPGTVRNTSDSPLPRGIADTPPGFSGAPITPPAPLATPAASAPAPFAGSAPATLTTTPAAAGGTRPFR